MLGTSAARLGLTVAMAMAIAAAGCSSLPIDAETTRVVPADRIFASNSAGRATSPGDGTMTILRDWGFGGGGCNFDVFLDGNLAANIHLAEKLELHAPAGHHFLRVETSTFLCHEQLLSQDVTLSPGDDQQYRIQIGRFNSGFARIK